MLDIPEISQMITEGISEGPIPDFCEIYQKLAAFDIYGLLQELLQWLKKELLQEFVQSWESVIALAGIILFSIVFSNLADCFKNYNVAESVSVILYFLVFFIILKNFEGIHDLYFQSVQTLMNVMKAIVPVYSLAITMTGNLTFASVTYEYFFVIVIILEYLALHLLGPLVYYYLLLELINHFSKDQVISNFCNLLYSVLSKGGKIICGLFFGVHLLELMLVPAFDKTGQTILSKVVDIIPGFGSIVVAAGSTATGSAILLKNTLGASFILFLFFVMLFPILKLLFYIMIYVLLGVLLEPICQKRYISCIEAVRKSGVLYLQALIFCMILFLLSLALCAIVTNG